MRTSSVSLGGLSYHMQSYVCLILGWMCRVWSASCYQTFNKPFLLLDDDGKVMTYKTDSGSVFPMHAFKCKKYIRRLGFDLIATWLISSQVWAAYTQSCWDLRHQQPHQTRQLLQTKIRHAPSTTAHECICFGFDVHSREATHRPCSLGRESSSADVHR